MFFYVLRWDWDGKPGAVEPDANPHWSICEIRSGNPPPELSYTRDQFSDDGEWQVRRVAGPFGSYDDAKQEQKIRVKAWRDDRGADDKD